MLFKKQIKTIKINVITTTIKQITTTYGVCLIKDNYNKHIVLHFDTNTKQSQTSPQSRSIKFQRDFDGKTLSNKKGRRAYC